MTLQTKATLFLLTVLTAALTLTAVIPTPTLFEDGSGRWGSLTACLLPSLGCTPISELTELQQLANMFPGDPADNWLLFEPVGGKSWAFNWENANTYSWRCNIAGCKVWEHDNNGNINLLATGMSR